MQAILAGQADMLAGVVNVPPGLLNPCPAGVPLRITSCRPRGARLHEGNLRAVPGEHRRRCYRVTYPRLYPTAPRAPYLRILNKCCYRQ